MKPTFQFAEKSRRDRSDSAFRKTSTQPKTDYSFQAASPTTGGHCFTALRPSFFAISQGYFENEAGRNFASEAGLFFVMAVTATLPILSSLSAVAHLVRSYAAL